MTAQFHQLLILNGEETSMAFYPLFPENHPRIIRVSDEEALESNPLVFSTACWRGYVGTWEIKTDQFYLIQLTGRYHLSGSEPVFADWFSGVVRIARGEILQYVHMGFGSVFEEELHIKIENGKVVKSQVIDNRGKQFDPWKLSKENLPGGENRFHGDDL